MVGTNYWVAIDSTKDGEFTDKLGYWENVRGTAANVPSAVSGYAVGCVYTATDTGAQYVNTGSVTSCTFSQVPPTLVTSAFLDPSVIQVATHALTSAEIKAANTTPVTLVAGVTGKTIVVDDICLKMVTTATAYANGGALEFRYTNASGAKVTADIAAAVVTAGAGTSYTINKSVVTSLTGVVSSPIVMDNATAAFITGTGTGTITVQYHLI